MPQFRGITREQAADYNNSLAEPLGRIIENHLRLDHGKGKSKHVIRPTGVFPHASNCFRSKAGSESASLGGLRPISSIFLPAT